MMKVKKEDGREDYFSKVYDLKEELGKGMVQFLFLFRVQSIKICNFEWK